MAKLWLSTFYEFVLDISAYLCGRTQAERGHSLGNNLENHFLDGELLRPNVAEHLAWLRLWLTRHAQQLGVVANVVLSRGDVFVDERCVARAQHNQIEEGVGDQLTWRATSQTTAKIIIFEAHMNFVHFTFVNNPDSQAYRLGKNGNDIYSQVDFIVSEGNGTVELFAKLVVQVANLDAISFGRIFIAVVIADVPELVAWLDVENIWQTFREMGGNETGLSDKMRRLSVFFTYLLGTLQY